ncbi:hypothetical protein CHCC14819_0479 [Bacillus licheniformis]|nr:hypothetical protein CHCC14819_0479 [Bacillus licheniformis]
MDYFQKESISTVTKTDVIKFILKQTRAMVELDKIDEFREELEKEARAGGVEL